MILLNNVTSLFGCLTGKPIIAAIGHNSYNASDESCRLSAAKSAATQCDLSARTVRDGKTRKTRKSTQVVTAQTCPQGNDTSSISKEATTLCSLAVRYEICVLCCYCFLFCLQCLCCMFFWCCEWNFL